MRKGVFFLLVVTFIFPSLSTKSQDWNYEVRIGCNLLFNQSLESFKHKYPSVKIFVSGFINRVYNERYYINYGTSISLYKNSIGNNMNAITSGFEIDNLHSFSFGLGGELFKTDTIFPKYFRTVNNSTAYNAQHNFESSVIVSTNLVINNHKRHQFVGSYTFTLHKYTLNYYNDGGFFVNWLPISDNFDRWWTGGLNLIHHDEGGFNSIEIAFDQFTGYNSLMYELSTAFGMDVPGYDYPNGRDNTSNSYNTSSFNIRYTNDGIFFYNLGMTGNFRPEIKRKRYYFGLQDILHIRGKTALHSNYETNKIHFGVQYNPTLINERI